MARAPRAVPFREIGASKYDRLRLFFHTSLDVGAGSLCSICTMDNASVTKWCGARAV
jgi:hypothetical protein